MNQTLHYHIVSFLIYFWLTWSLLSNMTCGCDSVQLPLTCIHTGPLLFQLRLYMATDWEWAANQPRPPVATWRPVRGTRFGSCPAGSEAPRPLARSDSCSCWWRRRSAGWNGRVRYCVCLQRYLFWCIVFMNTGVNSQVLLFLPWQRPSVVQTVAVLTSVPD